MTTKNNPSIEGETWLTVPKSNPDMYCVRERHCSRSLPGLRATSSAMHRVPWPIDGFHVTSSLPCWWTKTKDFSLASFVRPQEVVRFSIVIGVSRDWLKMSYSTLFN